MAVQTIQTIAPVRTRTHALVVSWRVGRPVWPGRPAAAVGPDGRFEVQLPATAHLAGWAKSLGDK